MLSFEKLYSMGHEEVIFCSDPSCNLKAIVAIHNTVLGPALGGTRMWPYKSEDEAIEDVLRLSKGMTYKASISGLNLGGGKAVIIGDPEKDKSEALFRSYGRFLESLNGRYITAEDVNISVEDIEHIFTETTNVVGVAKIHGGSGNPAPYTALGTFSGIQACCYKKYGDSSLKGKKVAVQGVGAVGHYLVEMLINDGATVAYCDVNSKNIDRMKSTFPQAELVGTEDIYDLDFDIYAPCALGATVNDETIDRFKFDVVAGCANNQLKEERHGLELKKKGIVYGPDFLINAGGLMNVSIEFEGWSDDKAKRMVDTIYDTTLKILDVSDKEDVACNVAANLLAERRIESIKKIKSSYLGNVGHRFPGRKSRLQ